MLQSLDIAVFRFINSSLSNPAFDWAMPRFSDSPYFFPVLIFVLIALAWKGGVRGRLCVAFVLLAVIIGDGWICDMIKHSVERPRPFMELPDVKLLVGKGGSGSMPSSHAANWFAATMVTFIFYRRSWWILLPLASAVSLSRIYNGVHYPSDVLAGAILGAGYATAIVGGLEWVWQTLGKRWFPMWWERLPSLIRPEKRPTSSTPTEALIDLHWLRLGYLFTVLLFVIRLCYIHSSIIELSEDEAYQWTWSKHLALSYYSKPPLIALVQFLGTHLWGDREFGIRFFSPVISAALSFLLLRFLSRQISARFGFAVILMLTAAPLLAAGSTLMTIDPISVLFWTMTMIAGWRAIQSEGTTRDWLWVGTWMGFGFLSKYTNLFEWLCWITLFLLYPPSRKQLTTPGPYLGLLINALFTIPVLIWNAQHHWITIEHVSNDGALGNGWHPKTFDFIGAEFILLNPFFFVAFLIAMFVFWRRARTPLAIFLFAMGAPLFLFYFIFSFHSRVLPNWIAPSIVPLFCLAGLCWRDCWSKWWFKRIFAIAVFVGIFVGVLGHDTNLIGKLVKRPLPAKVDPSRRVRAWSGTAARIGIVKRKLESHPSFIICDHYGMTGELSFYLPEARATVGSDKPVVYYMVKDHPENQFYFWPNYLSRRGENAIFVQSLEEPKLVEGWFSKWRRGEANIIRTNLPVPVAPPKLIQKQFESVKDLGIFKVEYRGRIFRHFQLFECQNLLPTAPQPPKP